MCYIHRSRPQKHRLTSGLLGSLRRIIRMGGQTKAGSYATRKVGETSRLSLETLNGLGYVMKISESLYEISPIGRQIIELEHTKTK